MLELGCCHTNSGLLFWWKFLLLSRRFIHSFSHSFYWREKIRMELNWNCFNLISLLFALLKATKHNIKNTLKMPILCLLQMTLIEHFKWLYQFETRIEIFVCCCLLAVKRHLTKIHNEFPWFSGGNWAVINIYI